MGDPQINLVLLLAIKLFGAHVFCDMPGQGQFLSDLKRPKLSARYGKFAWIGGLIYHGAIHGPAVAFLTGSASYALFTLITHAVIDAFRVNEKISFVQDQLCHLAVIAGIFGHYASL